MGKLFGGGVSASQQNNNGTQQHAIDPVVQGFVNNDIIGGWRNLIQGIPGIAPGSTPPSSFIAGPSADTEAYRNAIRALNPAGANDAAGNSLAQGFMTGQFNAPGTSAEFMTPTGYSSSWMDSAKGGPLADTGFVTGYSQADPYRSAAYTNVVAPALNEFDTQSARNMNARRAARDAGSAFGDRSAVADSVYQGEIDRQRAVLHSGLLKDAEVTAQGFARGDADSINRALSQDSSQQFQQGENNADRTQQMALDNAARQDAARRFAAEASNLASGRNADAVMDINKFNIGTHFGNLDRSLAGANLGMSLDNNSWARAMQSLGLLNDSGATQDADATSRLREPLDLILQAASIAGGVPYGSTTTSQSRSRGKGATLGAG
ncbi:MAG: hypothetical protein JNK21_00925 [Rhodospirillaceae bacterium]|nr:hypothetical protein [Rhodospirillaceae bacterium]